MVLCFMYFRLVKNVSSYLAAGEKTLSQPLDNTFDLELEKVS